MTSEPESDTAPERPEWNTGGGDHDQAYRFDRHPLQYLHVREFARLLVLRGKVVERELLRLRRGDFGGEP